MAVSPNAARAYAYFVGRGFSPVAAAGMVGNLVGESTSLDTGAYNPNDPGGSHGIGQWNRERLAAMQAYKDPSARDELERQLSFIVSELGGSEKRAGGLLRGAGSLEQGVRGGLAYERPANQDAAYAKRYAAAQQVLADAGVSAGAPGAPQAAAAAAASGAANIGELKAKLQAEFPQLRFTSGDRSSDYNAKVGGAKNSQHTHGTAFDIGLKELPDATRQAIINRAVELGARGIGYYPGSQSAHIDMRTGAPAAWGPNYSYSSIKQTPDWFQSAAARVRSGQNAVASTPSVGSVAGGGGGVTAPPPTPVPEAPPDYAAMNLASGMDMLSGGTGEQATATPPPPSLLEPEPAPAQQAAVPPAGDGGDGQASAATLMATILDNKRQQRSGLPIGLLG
jgi:hypothetical protein